MSDPPVGYARGDAGYRRASLALLVAGIATFAALYTTQPLLPLLSRSLHVGPATSTLSLAVTTAMLALALLPAGWLSDRWGRVPVMTASLFGAALLGGVAALAPSFGVLLVVRAAQGVVLAGLPAVGMTYLTEEIDAGSLGSSVGLYIGGNGFGGMAGRLLAGGLAGPFGWRGAIAGDAALSLICAVLFWRIVPASRRHRPAETTPRGALQAIALHLRDPGQRRLDAMAALLMGTFVAVYNGLGFRLEAKPYGLSEAALGAVFLIYPIGSVASAITGRVADRLGRRRVLPIAVLVALGGVALSLTRPLPLLLAGIVVLTIGFFSAHSLASSWVGRRAVSAPAQASALYLLAYYAGSSIGGPLGGLSWSLHRWPGVAALAGLLLLIALTVSLQLRRTPPLRPAVA